MSSKECDYEGCSEPTKGQYCPEHEAEYQDYLYDSYKDGMYDDWEASRCNFRDELEDVEYDDNEM